MLKHILRAASRSHTEPLNILTSPTHERFETGLAATCHNFYAWRGPGIKDWNRVFAPLPSNYTILDPSQGEAQLPPDVAFDLVLSQNKFGQFPVLSQLAKAHHLPLVSLEHTLPHPDWEQGMLRRMKEMRGDVNVFISDYSRDAWGWGEDEANVIDHGVDTGLFCPPPADHHRRPVILAVVNDWINRDWCCGFNLWREVTEGLPCFVVGDTPGLSLPAQTTAELVYRYQQSAIFINTATQSPIPTVLLEAMSCGCAVVSTENPMTTHLIRDGVNGFITNDRALMRERLTLLLQSPDLCRRLGDAGRQTIERRHRLSYFVDAWDKLLRRAASIVPRVRDEVGRPVFAMDVPGPSGWRSS